MVLQEKWLKVRIYESYLYPTPAHNVLNIPTPGTLKILDPYFEKFIKKTLKI